MGLSYDALFPGRFLKAGEFGGKAVTLTVKDVYMDALEDESGVEKSRPIMSFKETKRELALNKTNAQCFVAMWGQDSGDWLGHKVTLFPERDASGLSDSGLCIRVAGSPEMSDPITATIKLPRRKPMTRKLTVTTKGKAAAHEDAPFDDDPAAPTDLFGGPIPTHRCTDCSAPVTVTEDATPADIAEMECPVCGKAGTVEAER